MNTWAGYERVLLVDDEPALLSVMSRLLAQGGLPCETCANATEAISAFSRARPTLAVVDLHMPAINGLDLIPIFRAIDPTVPVVVITGYADEDKRAACLRAGACAILQKPFPRDLANVLKSYAVPRELKVIA